MFYFTPVLMITYLHFVLFGKNAERTFEEAPQNIPEIIWNKVNFILHGNFPYFCGKRFMIFLKLEYKPLPFQSLIRHEG